MGVLPEAAELQLSLPAVQTAVQPTATDIQPTAIQPTDIQPTAVLPTGYEAAFAGSTDRSLPDLQATTASISS